MIEEEMPMTEMAGTENAKWRETASGGIGNENDPEAVPVVANGVLDDVDQEVGPGNV